MISKIGLSVQALALLGSIVVSNIGFTHQQVIQEGLQNATFKVGDSAGYLSVGLDPDVAETGQWYKNGALLSRISGKLVLINSTGYSQLVVYNVQLSDAGLYSYNISGESTSAYLSVLSNQVNGGWSPWSEWVSNCPATCNTTVIGTKTRSRICDNVGQCPGSQQESQQVQCGQANCRIDGLWSNWGNWGEVTCSQTCGTSAMGTRERNRQCTNPSPLNGGSDCFGSKAQTESASCASLSSCSVILTGLQDTTKPAGDQVYFIVSLNQGGLTGIWSKDGVQLTSSDRIQIAGIDTNPYLVITGLVPADSGRYNFTVGGETTSAYLTVTGQVPIKGGWSNWGNWGEVTCSQTCGTSAMCPRMRSRTCTNPSPQNGGSQCLGSGTETGNASCASLPSCSVFVSGLQDATQPAGGQAVLSVVLNQGGLTGMWSKDGVQLSSSGRIQITRSDTNSVLSITGLVPADSGRYDFTVGGETTSSYLTVTGSGPINGGWSVWTFWSSLDCSQTCGTSVSGVKNRNRTCTNPLPQNGGANCQGSSIEFMTDSCVRPQCPIHGGWSEWGQWGNSVCPQTCSPSVTGNRTRSRYCNNPPPQFGGSTCPGTQTNTEPVECGTSACKEWSPWFFTTTVGSCSLTCGGGSRQRTYTRTCNNAVNANSCPGSNTKLQSETCNAGSCPESGLESKMLFLLIGVVVGMLIMAVVAGIFGSVVYNRHKRRPCERDERMREFSTQVRSAVREDVHICPQCGNGDYITPVVDQCFNYEYISFEKETDM